MTSLTMMGLTPIPLVHTRLPFFIALDDSVGSVHGLWCGVFAPEDVKYKCDIFEFVVFVPIGVESKGGRIIKMFWHSDSLFSLQI